MPRNLVTLSLAVMLVGFAAGCSQDLSPLNTKQTSYAPTPTPIPPANDLLDNFDVDPGRSLWWQWAPGMFTQAVSTDYAVSGVKSFKFNMGAATSWGAGSGMSYTPEGSFPGATKFEFWLLSTGAMTFQIYWTEGTSLGADGDNWMANITVPGDSAWHLYSFPLASMTGGTIPDPQSVSAWWWDCNGPFTPYGAHAMYFDDFRFKP